MVLLTLMTGVSATICLVAVVAGKVTKLSNVLYNGTVTDETVSGHGSLDGEKLSSTSNDTTYEWWYFDVVSTSSPNETMTIVFYNAGPNGFSGGYFNGPLSVEVSGTFANGTTFDLQASASVQAVIMENAKGLNGEWHGAGATFRGSSLSRRNIVYDIEIDSPQIEAYGKIAMKSRAPPRYACGADIPGTNELAFHDVGWANAIPDADAKVDFTIGDTALHFKGLGYHDKNWGLTPFFSNVAHTYWGHARAGPYSVVWSDGQIPDHGQLQEYVSGMVAKDNKLLTVNCNLAEVAVRPWGVNDDYPPTVATGPPQGLEVTASLGKEGMLALNITSELILIDEPYYQRFIGSVKASVDGCIEYEGKALYEQFKFIGATVTRF